MNNRTCVHALTIASILTLTACAGTAGRYEPVVDGPKNAQYVADLQGCQQVAQTRKYINADTKTEAAMTAGLAAVVGALDDGMEGAIGGAVVGGLIGGGQRAWETREERKDIVVECMQQRGHAAVG